ncbi:hypothetical protein D3227_38265 [Mesorhizobium waimense]|uniref:Uncharacterized protein n=1 Tax=Mesorhizobium waimense TaxID=1300307 RepID=A0A3A5JUS9_9HYPH|nr:hypothetical protein [Mesorhizobium waimense]RJT23811.1 hypothetical protein D3227_38265 [Mesorhizobium waimense]
MTGGTSASDEWQNHVDKIEAILHVALRELRKEGVSGNETHMNREFYFRILRANQQVYRQSPAKALSNPPTPEAQNLPSRSDAEPDPRTKKIPDFQWSFIDHEAEDPDEGVRTYVIECKKLGKPDRADWNYNENYANHGVLRFVHPAHLYGKDAVAGAMVGYVHSMEFSSIHSEVDTIVSTHAIASLPHPATGWIAGGVSTIDHELTRAQGVSPYKLRHFWVDLRPPAVAV